MTCTKLVLALMCVPRQLLRWAADLSRIGTAPVPDVPEKCSIECECRLIEPTHKTGYNTEHQFTPQGDIDFAAKPTSKVW